MPYIPQEDRLHALHAPRTPGELNYAITMLLRFYMAEKGVNYTFINDCLGAMEGAKMEFNRRVVVPYEKAKIMENGDLP